MAPVQVCRTSKPAKREFGAARVAYWANAGAAPATVSGEPSLHDATGHVTIPPDMFIVRGPVAKPGKAERE